MSRKALPVCLCVMAVLLVCSSSLDNDTTFPLNAVGEGGDAPEPGVEPTPEEMQSLLNWAIGHSDPEKLKEMARDAVRTRPDVLEQRQKIQELMEELDKRPTEAQLMKEAISMISNLSLAEDMRASAINVLQELVEPIDNANDMPKMGGLDAILPALDRSPAEQLGALGVLGTAASNNVKFQEELLAHDPHIITRLVQVVASACGAEPGGLNARLASQAIYALSAVTRNLQRSLDLLWQASGVFDACPACSAHLRQDPDLPESVRALVACARLFASAAQGAVQQAAVKRSMGLLTDMVSRDERIARALGSSPMFADTWLGMCEQVGVQDADVAEQMVLLALQVMRQSPSQSMRSRKVHACLRRLEREVQAQVVEDDWLEDVVAVVQEALTEVGHHDEL